MLRQAGIKLRGLWNCELTNGQLLLRDRGTPAEYGALTSLNRWSSGSVTNVLLSCIRSCFRSIGNFRPADAPPTFPA